MTYHRPKDLPDALRLAALGAKVLAGGTDVFPACNGRELQDDVLDLTAVAGLRGVSVTDAGWRIGATTRWSDIFAADLPPRCCLER